MITPHEPVTVLVAADDRDDSRLVGGTLEERAGIGAVHCVRDGDARRDDVQRRGRYAPPTEAQRLDLGLRGLNTPKRSVRERLSELQPDWHTGRTPVVVLTGPEDVDAIVQVYDLGATLYITKPATSSRVAAPAKLLARYWMEAI